MHPPKWFYVVIASCAIVLTGVFAIAKMRSPAKIECGVVLPFVRCMDFYRGKMTVRRVEIDSLDTFDPVADYLRSRAAAASSTKP
jgi:hypothetical protein